MSIASYIKEIGRGRDGARSLDRAQAHDLMSQVLDGRVTDLELGAFALAMRIKGESVAELAGFLDATHERCIADGSTRPTLVLPSYNGARKLPNLTALLALLLAQDDVQVLVHGPCATRRASPPREIFHDLGLHLRRDARRARRRLGAARARVHPHRSAVPAAGAAARRAAGRRAAQFGPHRRQAARPVAAARCPCASSTTPIPTTAPCWPSFLARPARTRC